MSLVDVLRNNDTVRNYFSSYSKEQKPYAVLQVILYGINNLQLNHGTQLKLDQLLKLNKRGQPLAPRNFAPSRQGQRSTNITPKIEQIAAEVDQSLKNLDENLVKQNQTKHKKRSSSMNDEKKSQKFPEWWLGLGTQLDKVILKKPKPAERKRKLQRRTPKEITPNKTPVNEKALDKIKRQYATFQEEYSESPVAPKREFATYNNLFTDFPDKSTVSQNSVEKPEDDSRTNKYNPTPETTKFYQDRYTPYGNDCYRPPKTLETSVLSLY